MKTAYGLLLLVALTGCSAAIEEPVASKPPAEKTEQAATETRSETSKPELGSIGVISLAKAYGEKDFVRIYNEDGSLWYEFSYYYDDSDGKFDYENENFAPFSFHPDYSVLALRGVGEDKERYKVIVNEDSGLAKYVRKDDRVLERQSWEEHILKVSSIDFDPAANPVRESPDGNVKAVKAEKGEPYRPLEIKGDWLKLKWSEGSGSNTEQTGWIKWRDDGKMLLELFYFS